MGLLRGLVLAVSAMVALVAVLLGLLLSGALAKTGIFRRIDSWELGRGQVLKGLAPVFHEGTAWGFTLEQLPELDGRVAVVTGACSGLGYWSAHHLAHAGATVVVACRTTAKGEEAVASIRESTARGELHALALDLSSFASVHAFARAVNQRFSSVDSLILNAGVMVPPFSLTADGLESQIGVNHFGHALLTRELMRALEAAASARGASTVVAVSSSAHYTSYPEGILPSIAAMNDAALYDRGMAYGQSKLANVLFAQELARRAEAAGTGVLANSVHPGVVKTNLGRHLETLVSAYLGEWAWSRLDAQLSQAAWHPREAALTQLYAAAAPDVIERRVSGKYFHPIARETKPDPHATNLTLQEHLWALTEAYLDAHAEGEALAGQAVSNTQ